MHLLNICFKQQRKHPYPDQRTHHHIGDGPTGMAHFKELESFETEGGEGGESAAEPDQECGPPGFGTEGQLLALKPVEDQCKNDDTEHIGREGSDWEISPGHEGNGGFSGGETRQ